MNRRHALKALTGLVLCPLCASTGSAAEGAHWTYEGTTGPANWGDVDAASKVCSVGSQQSPIDINGSIKAQLPPLRNRLGQDRRYHCQQRSHNPTKYRQGYAHFRRRALQAIAVSLPSSERAPHPWQELSDGGAFCPCSCFGRAGRGRCADGGGKAQPGIQQDRHNHANA